MSIADNSFQGPWSVSSNSPIVATAAVKDEYPQTTFFTGKETFADSVCFIWLKVYQHYLSLLNTGKCRMEPSCSNYSVQAVKKHGAFKGIILTADRLLHEMGEQRYVPVIKKGKRYKYLDPVENNDFWWYTTK